MEENKVEITLGKKKYMINKFLIDRLNDLNVTIVREKLKKFKLKEAGEINGMLDELEIDN